MSSRESSLCRSFRTSCLFKKGKQVTLVANDLDLQILTVAEIGEENSEMSTTISARKLTDILATLPDTNPLSFSKKGDHVVLSSGKSKFELQTISAEEFPVITEVDLEHAFTMSCLRFKYLLNMVSFGLRSQQCPLLFRTEFISVLKTTK